MRRYDVNFEEKEEVQGPKTDELIFRLPLGAASRRGLPAPTFDGGGVPGEQRDVAAIASLEKNMVHSVWFPTQASRPWKLLQLEAEATRAR